MTQRLQLINSQISQKQKKYVHSAFQYFNAQQLLTQQQNTIRKNVRKFVDTEITPKISQYVQESKFPQYLIPKIREANILQYFIEQPYGKKITRAAQGCILAQLARGDPSIGTMFWLLTLNIQTILKLGSTDQINKFIPKLKNIELIGGWALTQQNKGSDASNLQSNVVENQEGYILNGNKKWIGNGNRDFLIIWAKNRSDNNNIQGFIVENSLLGVNSTPIKNKLAMRLVQNCQITLNNVILKKDSRLQKAKNFSTGPNIILKSSRIHVCWIALGVCLGVYDNVIKYASQRKQFGQSISSYQLIQQKIFKIMSNTQAILFICFRLSKLSDQNNISIGQVAIFKAWITQRSRQVTRLGRQILGGNGIIHQNYIMKALTDMEGIYTYEGTYDINILVGGRQLTGTSAIKK